MILALLIAGATPHTAIEAERAFAADAKRMGQRAASRKWAAPRAVMFVPQPVGAQDWLKDRADPAGAFARMPAQAFISCDGRTAAITGPSRQADGSVGYFSSVWARQADGSWRWIVDHSDAASTSSFDAARPAFNARLKPVVSRASCKFRRRWGIPPQGLFAADAHEHDGSSPDASLLWFWSVSESGARQIRVALWNGDDWENAIWDRVGFPDQQTEAASRE